MKDLREILRLHYCESEASELFHELSSAVQSSKENPTEFLMRLMDLRQRVLFSSSQGDGVKYQKSLVQETFIRALDTGLADDNIRIELRPTLQSGTATDEELMAKIVKIVKIERERRKKQGSTKKAVKLVSKVGDTDKETTNAEAVADKPATAKPDKFEDFKQEVMGMLKAGLSSIEEKIPPANTPHNRRANSTNSRPNNNRRYNNNNNRGRPRGCQMCRDAGNGESCTHCYRCGGSNHYARACRAQVQGNEQRSSRGIDA